MNPYSEALNWITIGAVVVGAIALFVARRGLPHPVSATASWLYLAFGLSIGVAGLLRATQPAVANGIQLTGLVLLLPAVWLSWREMKLILRRVGLAEGPERDRGARD